MSLYSKLISHGTKQFHSAAKNDSINQNAIETLTVCIQKFKDNAMMHSKSDALFLVVQYYHYYHYLTEAGDHLALHNFILIYIFYLSNGLRKISYINLL